MMPSPEVYAAQSNKIQQGYKKHWGPHFSAAPAAFFIAAAFVTTFTSK
jgi:hypothetical protein